MVEFLKKYWWIVLIAAIVVGYFIYRRYQKSISFDFALNKNAASILSDIAGAGSRIGLYLDVPLTTIIKNNNAATVVLQNIAGAISYNGEAIMQTKPNSAVLQSVSVAGKSNASITDNVQLIINPSTIKFFTELVKGNKPAIKYNFSTLVFGKPQTITNQTTINQS